MSEFGKGLIICLVKFAEHSMKLYSDLEIYEKMRRDHPDSFTEPSAIHSWANGASDHLYEIEVPEGKDWYRIRKKVEELQTKGLDMGHGFTRNNYTKDDALELFKLTQEIALMVDRKLGLKPQLGDW